MIAIAISALLALLLCAFAAWLFLAPGGPSDSKKGKENNQSTSDELHVDGLVIDATEQELTLKVEESDEEMHFAVSEEAMVDVAHLKVHAAMNLPTRVFYRKGSDGKRTATWIEDAPL